MCCIICTLYLFLLSTSANHHCRGPAYSHHWFNALCCEQSRRGMRHMQWERLRCVDGICSSPCFCTSRVLLGFSSIISSHGRHLLIVPLLALRHLVHHFESWTAFAYRPLWLCGTSPITSSHSLASSAAPAAAARGDGGSDRLRENNHYTDQFL